MVAGSIPARVTTIYLVFFQMNRRLFTVVYTCSGAAALVYEVAWTRLLTLQFGHTVAATSIVLAAFMGGLAIGAWAAGSVAGRIAQPQRLMVYAVLELLVAAAAVALPLLLSAASPALGWAYADATTPIRFTLTRILLGLVLLGIPAAAMGATFPLAAAWFARGDEAAAGDASRLYAANTAGAAVGALAAGFWVIPAIGLRGATWTGVALNAIAAGGAFWLGRQEPAAVSRTASAPVPKPRAATRRASSRNSSRALQAARMPQPVLGCAAAAISGFAALVYEVTWTRLIAVIVGPTTYAFATMAATFIGGLAIGSTVGTRIVRRSRRPAVWLSVMLVLSAAAAAVSAWLAASWLPLLIANLVVDTTLPFGALLLRRAAMIGALLLPMTFAPGATFPLALSVASAGASSVSRDTARVYTANTCGAIAGSLSAGFLLVPYFGLRATLHGVAIAGVLAGAMCLAISLADARSGRLKAVVTASTVALASTALILLLPQWDRRLLSSGAYLYAAYLQPGDLDILLEAGDLDYYKEGAAGIVTVRTVTGRRSLTVDGKVDASTGSDMPTQRLLGLLPVLLHPRPDDVCVIGLGSGVTIATALAAGPVRSADVVEISPEVVEASRLFARQNKDVFKDPRVRTIVGDGRSHLALTTRRYDVIVSQPSNPWMAGIAALFTHEYLESARSRLKPDGVFGQWAHTYDISADDLRSIVRTFTSVFPEATLWMIGDTDLLLLGTNGTMAPHLTAFADQVSRGGARGVLAEMGIPQPAGSFALASLFVGGQRELASYADGATIQNDDRMALEFSTPRDLRGQTSNHNAAAIRALAASAVKPPAVQDAYDRANDESWAARAKLELDAEAYGLAYDALKQAATLNSRNQDALMQSVRAAARSGRLAEVRAWLESLVLAEPDNAVVRIELSRMLVNERNFTRALELSEEALRLAPNDTRGLESLAAAAAASGDVGRLSAIVDMMATRLPDFAEVYYYRALSLVQRGRPQEAMAEVRRGIAATPQHDRETKLLGVVCLSLDQRDCARTALEAALRADPSDSETYIHLGELSLRSGDPSAAVSYFAQGLSLNRASKPGMTGLSAARAALGRATR